METRLPTSDAAGTDAFDVDAIRAQFAILDRSPHGKRLAYLDNAATTQNPNCVLQAEREYYEQHNANVHRAVHLLAQEATAAYENARHEGAHFLNANRSEEIIFCRGTTEALNLVANAAARPRVGPDDEILITHMEHHSNIVPWQMVCEQTGATLKAIPLNDNGELCLDQLDTLLNERTRFVCITHLSNALGTINPLQTITARAREVGALVVVDGAQSAQHLPIDVQQLDCDFFACSGHKMFGPMGIGMLWGRFALLNDMPPWQGGGEMIEHVTIERSTYNVVPFRFEAGTPNVGGAVGLAAAMKWRKTIDDRTMLLHESALLDAATDALDAIDGVTIYSRAREKASVLAFNIDGVHAHDVGTILDTEGVAVRTGHHCAQPIMDHFSVPSTVRASFSMYNTMDDVEQLVQAVHLTKKMFA